MKPTLITSCLVLCACLGCSSLSETEDAKSHETGAPSPGSFHAAGASDGGTAGGGGAGAASDAASDAPEYAGQDCAAAAEAGVWCIQATPKGFEWVAPDGTKVCKYVAMSKVDSFDLQGAGTQTTVLAKYGGDWTQWRDAQTTRLKSWGFNAAGMYSYRYEQYPGARLPSAPSWNTSLYAMRDSNGQHVKDAFNIPDPNGMICGSRVYQGLQMDVFDPRAADVLKGLVGGATGPCRLTPMDRFMFFVADEADYLFGLNSTGYHADLGYVVAANSPMVKTSPVRLGGTYNYPDATLYAKLALRDFLAAKYGCAGSADPAAINYCGATDAGKALGAVNAAWGTSYTTWNTSDAGGLAGIKAGTYASYGTGTGFLDENGEHIVAQAQRSHCGGHSGVGLTDADPWSTVPQIATDVHEYVTYFATTYAQIMRDAYSSQCGAKLPPLFIPIYGGPNAVYTAMAPYFDGFWINPTSASNANVALIQRIVDAAGGKPVIVADYMTANPDSQIGGTCTGSSICYASQANRGAGMVAHWKQQLAVKNPQNRFAVIGLEHWSFYDSKKENADFGLVSFNDNPYDGTATTAHGELANHGDAITPIKTYLNGGICDP